MTISSVPWPFARDGVEVIARRVFTCAVLLAAVAGCNDFPLSPRERQELVRARARWAANGSDTYTVEARIVCFCPPHLALWTRLTVRDGVIMSAVPVESLPDGLEPDLSGWLTVEEEFDRLANPPGILEAMAVRYDQRLGFPAYISADCGPNVADCGSVHEMRNVRFPAAVARCASGRRGGAMFHSR